jgi:hypothetical protein
MPELMMATIAFPEIEAASIISKRSIGATAHAANTSSTTMGATATQDSHVKQPEG